MLDDLLPFTDPDKVRPFLYEDERSVAMHFDISAVQSRMRRDDPYRLDLEYTRAMMGFLLLHPDPRTILAIGLGGGSLPKYCHRHLPQADISVVEINPHVIEMRDAFLVPPDDARFRVVLDDGARFVAATERHFDALLVDGFTGDGQPEQLCTLAFYDACRSALSPGGVMVINLHAEAPMCDALCGRITRSFGEDAVLFVPTGGGTNLVALALKSPGMAPATADFDRRWNSLAEVHRQTLRASYSHIASALRARRSSA